jgi:hypothetical protein
MTVKLTNLDFRSVIIAQRPFERSLRKTNHFIPMVTNKIPIGLPPIKTNLVTFRLPNKYTKNASKTLRERQEMETNRSRKKKRKSHSQGENFRSEIYKNEKGEKAETDISPGDFNGGRNMPKENLVKDLYGDPENEEILKKLSTVDEFDFDKYVKDNELRDALYLIKSEHERENRQGDEADLKNKTDNIDIYGEELHMVDKDNILSSDCEDKEEQIIYSKTVIYT